jgi:hypothetical protein
MNEARACYTDIFAMRSSNFDAFLYADVGVELNGSSLTTLSMLARLGEDPWTLAARWAREPRAAVTEQLTASICRMPLAAAGIQNARSTASQLVLLLPTSAMSAGRRVGPLGTKLILNGWGRTAFICFGFLVWTLVTAALVPALQRPIGTSGGQTSQMPRPTAQTAESPPEKSPLLP